jgi:DNA-binding NarL/FixJ family response regulator
MLDQEPAETGERVIGVLICDDVAAVRALLKIVIDKADGMRVVGEARDGDEAIARARKHQPDVVLLDLAMPRRSGLDALPEIVAVAPNTQVIVFSGFAASTVANDVVALGAALYIEKGASPTEITAAIREVGSRRDRAPRSAAARLAAGPG